MVTRRCVTRHCEPIACLPDVFLIMALCLFVLIVSLLFCCGISEITICGSAAIQPPDLPPPRHLCGNMWTPAGVQAAAHDVAISEPDALRSSGTLFLLHVHV